jgi:hypothetical protein
MAYTYSLSIECEYKSHTETLSNYFSKLPYVLSIGTWEDKEGNFWCVIVPDMTSHTDKELTPILYKYLKTAPSVYRYALIGLEVDEFRELNELMKKNSLSIFPGLIINERLGKEFNDTLEAFSDGYLRVPFKTCT